jgi:predicted alpha-1,6-mannanase (GH76 family)
VEAVDRHLTVRATGDGAGADNQLRVLRCDGTGDGGLFTGILCRYLALAAADQRLPQQSRATAGNLVAGTADAFWTGRRPAVRGDGRGRGNEAGRFIFPIHAADRRELHPEAGAAVELSTQLQAWMAIEAAASIAALDYGTQQFRN